MKLFATIIFVSLLIACPLAFGAQVVIFNEDTAAEAGGGDFAALFGSHDNGSTVEITSSEAYAGSVSAVATSTQSYNNVMGFSYSIDEYPYLTFAWKKDGGETMMLQLAHDEAWAYRYWSGPVNGPTWEGLQLEDTIPEDWMVYTVDLVADFGGGWNLTGLAFTPWDGDGFYDFMVLHSDPEPPTAVEPESKVATTWAALKSK